MTKMLQFRPLGARTKKKLARKWGHAIARGWATLLLDRSRDFVVATSSGGGNSSPLHDSQGVDELATLDRYHHFHGHSGLGALLVFPTSIGCLEFPVCLLAF